MGFIIGVVVTLGLIIGGYFLLKKIFGSGPQGPF